ncbi:zinc finger CCCH domain-containing protein 19-like isoform X2 [Phragmites australis]|uniref:zinc finger CCCH domain-containing protein 19-like isoform X2 n=1 Tax=Phragmites australis TaxID=29695 RepID=UPI002D78E041|nr:zinc finger CCCH domain-containing protein 19-like isoform X2 [Phragmites australis]
MTDAEAPPAMEEAVPTTPDIVLHGEGYKDDRPPEGEKDGGAPYGEGGKVDEGAELCGDDVVAAELAEDPNLPDVAKADEPEEDSSVEVRTDDVTASVEDPTEVGPALTPSTSVNAVLVDDDPIMVSAGGVCRSDGQTGQEVVCGSLDDTDEAAHLVNDVQDDGPMMDKIVTVNDDGEHAQDEERPQMDVATALSNQVETELVKTGHHAAGEGTNMDTLVQTGDDNEAEGVGTIATAAADEEGKHTGAVAMTRDDKEEDIGAAGDAAADEGIQTDRVVLTGDDSERKEFATADDDYVEEDGMQTDAVTMTPENVADEAVDVAVGIDVPEEKAVQMDEAAADVPEEAAVMDGVGLTGIDEQNEAVTADDDGVEEDTMQTNAAAMTNVEDEEDGIGGEDVADEAAEGMVGDDALEEEAAHMDEDDDGPPPLTRKGGGRRKRGRPSSKAQAAVKPSAKRKDEEEVCFICFDGGDLVVCDRRGCPKAYHPSCVNRDDDFFKSKGRWNCGWHICSNCQKPARHMCYTCTYSLCKACIKEAKFVCVRGFKGFCETCMNTVMLIENKEEATDQMDVDFDDKSSWWYLFKDYWLNLKINLSLTVEEISAAKSQKSGSSLVIRDNDHGELPDNNDEEANSESSLGRHLESNSSKKRGRKRSKQAVTEDGFEGKESTRKSTKRGLSAVRDAHASSGKKTRKLSRRALSSQHQSKESESVGTSTSSAEEASWASKELLNFLAHMRNGDKSVLTQFDVQALLLEYIKSHNLRDPRRKSQIVCDTLLQSLFAKERVGHFEMLKLLESHFLMSEVSPIDADDNHGGVVDPDSSQDADGNSEASVAMSSEKRRKSRNQRGRQPNLDDYAAIDNHNIGLMYLRRNLMEELIGDVDTFDDKVIGSFVRIRIPGTGQRQDIYRLVQIVGTGRAAEIYKSGKKTTDITLEILNLDKREVVTIDIISNQEFTEEECKRLRQSIKYGFIPRLTVGEVQEKARVLQALKVNDWIESEKMRLGHLRDRASDMGHRKELRECVEKLKLLSTPEERARRLNEEPEIHADPAMDPDYESPEEQEQEIERSSFNKSRGSFLRKDGNLASPGKGDGRNSVQRDPKSNWESNRNTWAESSSHMESPLARRSTFSSQGESAGYTSKSESLNIGAQTIKMESTTRNAPQGPSSVSSETLAANVGSGAKLASQSTVNESEKIWQYVDPSGKIQGPFSIVQLRKWNSSGYFPPNLKIWKSSEKQDDSILLTDALMGKFEKDLPPWEPPLVNSSQIDKTYLRSNSDIGAQPHNESILEENTKAGEQTPKSAIPNRSESFLGRDQRHDYGTTNHGSTMIQSGTQGYYGMQNSQTAYAGQQSLIGSWNAPSSQFGVTVNPMTPTQPAMGGFSAGQNIVVAGNMGNLTPVPAPATAVMFNSGLPSQNQISSVLPQRDGMLADGSESKLAEDASHGRLSSSGEDLGPLGAQPGPAQLNTQQPADTRSRLSSTDASNSMMPSQLMSAPSAESVQPSATLTVGGDSQSSGWAMPAQVANTSGQAQVAGNVIWGAAPQGDASMGWGMMGQSNMNMPWVASVQGATGYNMGLTMPTQPNAVPNMGWLTPNTGNTNMNMIWTATQGQGTPNAAAMMGAQMQGVGMAPWGGIAPGNANPYPGWGTQVGTMNRNVSWSGPAQGNPGQGNNNMNWNSPNGNPDWNNQQRDNGGRHSGHRGAFNASNSGGRSWKPRSGGDGGSRGHRPEGVCWHFLDYGNCSKGADCKYSHSSANDGYPSRNDRHFDRQHSGKERRYDNYNERNDRQFDRQPLENERHYDRHDDRHNDRDDDVPDDRQADRSQSREPR